MSNTEGALASGRKCALTVDEKGEDGLDTGEVPCGGGHGRPAANLGPEFLHRIATQAHPIPNASLKNRLLLLLAEVRQLLEDTHEDRFSAPSGRHVCPRIGSGRWLRRRKD
uniref:hypothetical protein n=1 Tax=Variovorax sp. BK018 TaxID=3450241 RepID=UPI004039E5E4